MDAMWPRRGLALIVLSLLVGVATVLPAMAAGNVDMQWHVDDFHVKADAKLEWLIAGLNGSTTNDEKLSWYLQAKDYLAQYADQAVAGIWSVAGDDPDLAALAEEYIARVNALEAEHLTLMGIAYEESLDTTTTTTSTTSPSTTSTSSTSTTSTTVATSTTTTVPKSTTTTVPKPTTTTIPKQTTTTVAPTTTTTVAPTTTTTVAGNATTTTTTVAVVAEPDSDPDDFVGDFGETPSGDAETSLLGDADPGSGDVSTPTGAAGDGFGVSSVLVSLEDSESLPATAMLASYVPADLPMGATEPVVGLFAILEMVVGAFLSSFRQLAGPVAASAIFLVYSVASHLRGRSAAS